MKKFILGVIVLVLISVVAYYFYQQKNTVVEKEPTSTPPVTTPKPQDVATTTPQAETNEKETVLGESVQGRALTAYHYGEGEKEILFVGGIHGGYEWNTALVAYELMDYLEENPNAVPEGVKVTVIPVMNPDGLNTVVGTAGRFTAAQVPASQTATIPGRFNANTVDLNRNFDCDWKASGVWQNRTVSGGTKAFSEPESVAVRDYIMKSEPSAVVVYYSAAGGVYASNCHDGILPETTEIMNVYAKASGYPAYNDFNFYEITGDMVNWLAKNDIPGISVLLTNHTDIEWNKNKAGIDALLRHYAE